MPTAHAPSTEPAARDRLHAQLRAVERAHQQAVASERLLLTAARDREAKVQAQIERLRPTVLTHPQDGDRYQALIAERGQLQQTIALAEHHLKNGW